MIVLIHPDACGALKKRRIGHWTFQRWTDNKSPHDGSEYTYICRVQFKRRSASWRSAGQAPYGTCSSYFSTMFLCWKIGVVGQPAAPKTPCG